MQLPRPACLLGLTLLLTAVPTAPPAAALPTPSGAAPPILNRIGSHGDVIALAVAPDGLRAALARTAPAAAGARRRLATILELWDVSADAPTTLEVPGVVRDLLWDLERDLLYVLQHRPARKSEGETYLRVIEPATLRPRRALRLPPSARGLDHWVAAGAVLVAARNELRTVLLPELRSGPLFRVPGNNRCVAALGDSRVLVCGASELLELDLDDPSGRQAMPVRDRAATPEPVVALAAASDGRSALARADSGRVYRVTRGPLALRVEGGPAAALAREAPPGGRRRERIVRAAEPDSAGAPEPDAPDDAYTAAVAAFDARGEDRPAGVDVGPASPSNPAPPAPQPAPTTPPVTDAPDAVPGSVPRPSTPPRDAVPPVTPRPETARTGTLAPSVGPAAAAVLEPDPPAPATPRTDDGPTRTGPPPRVALEPAREVAYQVAGRVTGPAADRVRAVVLFGPDSLLREAARVTPGADGRWSLAGLAPGRYRVLVDGGGDRVLVSEPRFLLVTIADTPQQLPDLQVLRAF